MAKTTVKAKTAMKVLDKANEAFQNATDYVSEAYCTAEDVEGAGEEYQPDRTALRRIVKAVRKAADAIEEKLLS